MLPRSAKSKLAFKMKIFVGGNNMKLWGLLALPYYLEQTWRNKLTVQVISRKNTSRAHALPTNNVNQINIMMKNASKKRTSYCMSHTCEKMVKIHNTD
jgi:hypothetical protein